MSRVDAHHHVWDITTRRQPWMSAPGYEPMARSFSPVDHTALARAAGVDASVVVQCVSEEAETFELLEIARTDPVIAAVVGWVDLTASDVTDRLCALRAAPGGEHLRGIRHQVHDEADPDWMRRRDVQRGIRAVGEAGLLYELLVKTPQLPAGCIDCPQRSQRLARSCRRRRDQGQGHTSSSNTLMAAGPGAPPARRVDPAPAASRCVERAVNVRPPRARASTRPEHQTRTPDPNTRPEHHEMIDDTTLMFRIAPLLLVAGTSLMATFVVFGNITDPKSNLQYVERIMSMDTTYRSPRLMWRAITSSRVQRIAFGCIVAVETVLAVIGWIGTIVLAVNLRASPDEWHDAKFWALVALCLALVVWFLVFDVGGNEWFASWQSDRWKAAEQTPRINLITLAAIILLALSS